MRIRIVREDYDRVKTIYDVTCVSLAAVITLPLLRSIKGIGMGISILAIEFFESGTCL